MFINKLDFFDFQLTLFSQNTYFRVAVNFRLRRPRKSSFCYRPSFHVPGKYCGQGADD